MAPLGFRFDPTSLPNFGEEFRELPDIPALAELRTYRQWVAWKWERRATAKGHSWTKPPVNPSNGFGASHSQPRTWGRYEDAVAAVDKRDLAGVGFVLTERDPFIGFDLDKCRNPETGEIEPWAAEILALAETYAEESPSGTGVRLIGRGAIEKVTKCDPAHVEIYASLRYLTITGRHIAGTPAEIREAPQTLEALHQRVAAHTKAPAVPATLPRPASPLVQHVAGEGASDFFRTVNDLALASLEAWVPSLFPSARRQSGTGGYRITSRDLGRDLEEDLSITSQGCVDFGVHDMGDARDGKRTPVDLVIEHGGAPDPKDAALWLCDRLGRDPEALGWADPVLVAREGAEIARRLVEGMESKRRAAYAAPPDYDPDAHAATIDDDVPDHLTRAPGLVGEIIDWIIATSDSPSRVLALGAALTLVGTAMGRFRAGPTLSSTALYVLSLAPTGAGKDHPLQCISHILTATDELRPCLGPDEFISGTAVMNFIGRAPLGLCPMDEFGSFLHRVNGRKAGGWEGQISKLLRTLWGTKYGFLRGAEWASRQSQTISAPHLSIYAASVHEEVFQALEGGDVTNGFLNRFLFLPIWTRPTPQEPVMSPFDVPLSITKGMLDIAGGGDPGVRAQVLSVHHTISPRKMEWRDAQAKQVFTDFRAEVLRRGDRDKELAPFLSRTAEMAVRLATIRAQGISALKPSVAVEDMEWGRDLAMWSAMAMCKACGLYIAETEAQADANRILRIVRSLGGRATRSNINQRLKHRMKSRDLEDTMKSLLESGSLVVVGEEKPPKGGKTTVWYGLGQG